MPLGRYKIVESKAADHYGLDKTPIEAEIEHAGQIVKVAMTNKARLDVDRLALGVGDIALVLQFAQVVTATIRQVLDI